MINSPGWIKRKKATINPINKKDSKINFPSKKDDWRKFEKNNVTIALNVLCALKKIWPAYVSQHNSSHEKQVILSII